MYYNFKVQVQQDEAVLLEGSFGAPAGNDAIVREVDVTLAALRKDAPLSGGELLKISGPMSMPVAFVVCHMLAHHFTTVAVFDPKLRGFVVVSSHGGGSTVGDLIP